MEEEEKIYALIVQAQESQKFVLEFREDAKHVLNSLPEAAKRAVKASAGEIMEQTKTCLKEATEATESILEQTQAGLMKAVESADMASERLAGRQLWGVVIYAVAAVVLVIVLGGVGYLGYLGWCKVLEHQVKVLDRQITERQTRLKALEEEIDRAEAVDRRLGKVQLTDCGMKNGRKRLCIRVNSTLPAFYGGANGQEEYRVIFGY